MSNFETLVNKAMFDPDFAVKLRTDPKAALIDLGIDPTPARLEAIAKVDLKAIEMAAEAIGHSGKKPMN